MTRAYWPQLILMYVLYIVSSREWSYDESLLASADTDVCTVHSEQQRVAMTRAYWPQLILMYVLYIVSSRE